MKIAYYKKNQNRLTGSQSLAFSAQRSCGNIQGQAGWSLEHSGLVEGVPACGRGVVTK